MNIYDFTVKDYLGNDCPLKQFEGKVVLIINSATKCGLTPQYEALEALYEKYADQGFVILDFPCNQFLGQAPGSGEEIHNVCKMRFGTKFPQFEKIKVNGKEAHPLFTYLKSQNPAGKPKRISWNFTKFLIARDGTFLERFEPLKKPGSFENKIVEALQK